MKTRFLFALACAAMIVSFSASADPVTSGEVPRVVQYDLDKYTAQLNDIEAELKRSKFKNAQEWLKALVERLANTKEWNKAKVSVDHPAYLALDKRAAELSVAIEAKLVEAAAVSEAIGPVVEAITESTPALEKAVTEGRFAIQGISSMESHYSQYRDPKKIVETLDTLRDKVEAANALMPAADNLVTHFQKQYPSKDALEAILPKDAYTIFGTVERLGRGVETWRELKERAVKEINANADKEIAYALAKLQSKTKADRLTAVGHAEMFAIGYHGRVLAAVDIIYPVDEQNPDSVLALTDAQRAEVDRAHQLQSAVAQMEKQISKIKKARVAAHKGRIAAARFPKSPPLSTNKAGVLQALNAEFGKPLRTGVYSGWQSRREARWLGTRWDVGVFNYIGVWVAKKTPAGKYRVFRTTLRQRKQADGSWGPIHYWSVGDSFEILKANIAK